MKSRKTIIMVLIGSMILVVTIGLLLHSLAPRSTNTYVAEVISPDSRLKAVIFERNSGATTGFSTQISILDSSQAMSTDAGNIFIADTDHGKAPSAAWGGPEVKVYWQGTKNLVIEHHEKSRIFRSDNFKDGVFIEYKKFN